MILDNSTKKPNKTWVDKGLAKFYNSLFKKLLKDNDTKMYSTHNEGKSIVTKGFIRTLKIKTDKHMTAVYDKKCVYW